MTLPRGLNIPSTSLGTSTGSGGTTSGGGSGGGSSSVTQPVQGGNPTAIASDVVTNGSAPTFMRSDASPAIQLISDTEYGIAKVDGTTITEVNGVISSSGGSTGANPTATASDTPVNGVATTFLRSDGAPAVQKGSASQFGIVKVDGTTITATAGVISSVGGGSGTVTTTGTPAPGNLTKFSGATSITNSDLTGDVTTTGTLATTLATVNSNVGTFGDATHVAQVTVNAKGLVTAASNVAITGGSGTFSASNYQLFDGTHYFAFPPAYQCTVPLAANFSWLRTITGATETASGGQLRLKAPAGAGGVVGRISPRGATTTLTAAFVADLYGGGSAGNNPGGAILAYESSSGKVVIYTFGYNNGPIQYGVWSFTASGATFGAVFSTLTAPTPLFNTTTFFRILISGATISYQYSLDGGTVWVPQFSEALTAHFTTTPDNWGYQCNSTAGADSFINLLSFLAQ